MITLRCHALSGTSSREYGDQAKRSWSNTNSKKSVIPLNLNGMKFSLPIYNISNMHMNDKQDKKNVRSKKESRI